MCWMSKHTANIQTYIAEPTKPQVKLPSLIHSQTLSIYLSINPSIHPCIYLSVCLSVCLSICLSFYHSIYLHRLPQFVSAPSPPAFQVGVTASGEAVQARVLRFTAREAMRWLRIMRPGSVIGEQQHYLPIQAAVPTQARIHQGSLAVPGPAGVAVPVVPDSDAGAANGLSCARNGASEPVAQSGCRCDLKNSD
jgi:hypothetical protein